MKITLFGSTGGVGAQLLQQALAAGHEVTAVTRAVSPVPTATRLTTLMGPFDDREMLASAIAGSDAVVCALGGQPRQHEHVCSHAMRSILPVMADCGVSRIMAISTFGAGDTRSQVQQPQRALLFGLVLRKEVRDKEAMERALAASGLQWTAIRVGRLTDEPGRGAWRCADDGSIRGLGHIACADVAAFMLHELDRTDWIGRRPVLMH